MELEVFELPSVRGVTRGSGFVVRIRILGIDLNKRRCKRCREKLREWKT
jgi:hypothetical protein